eukprot:contig_31356_g7656
MNGERLYLLGVLSHNCSLKYSVLSGSCHPTLVLSVPHLAAAFSTWADSSDASVVTLSSFWPLVSSC